MSVSENDIRTIASLAQLEIEQDAIEPFKQEMTNILALIHQMQGIDTSSVEPMPHPQDIQLRLRADLVTEPDQRSTLQRIAPNTEDGLYLVPKVLD